MKILKHAGVIIAALFILLGIPTLYYVDVFALFRGGTDAVSRATMELPEEPSGEFTVFLNRDLHPETGDKWETFFSGGDSGVIMDDISCLVMDGDSGGIQMAERFQARLAENQMTLRREKSLLLAGKAEHGLFDVLILSREAAEAIDLEAVYENGSISPINLKGGGD